MACKVLNSIVSSLPQLCCVIYKGKGQVFCAGALMLELRLCLGAWLLPFNCTGKQQDSASAMRHVQCADCRITTVTGSAVAWDPPFPLQSCLWCMACVMSR